MLNRIDARKKCGRATEPQTTIDNLIMQYEKSCLVINNVCGKHVRRIKVGEKVKIKIG
jgi:hypothetical protein